MASVLDPPAPLTLPSLAATPEKPRLTHAHYGDFHPLSDRCMGCGGQNICISSLPRPIPSTWDTYSVILMGLRQIFHAYLVVSGRNAYHRPLHTHMSPGQLWARVPVRDSIRTYNHTCRAPQQPKGGPWQVFLTLQHLSLCHPWPPGPKNLG